MEEIKKMEEALREVIRKHWKRLSKIPNVVGYSGMPQPRIRGGVEYPEELCLRIYVTRKVPEEELKEKEIIPKALSEIPIDVVAIGEIRALPKSPQDKRGRLRPYPAGCSAMHWEGTE